MEKDPRRKKYEQREGSHNVESDDLLDSLKKSPTEQTDISHLAEVYTELFGTDFLGDYTCYTNEPKQCSDGSDLYMLIKYEGKDLLVKVWAGEFNTQVFTIGNVEELKWFYNSPMPLFVVNQAHSYLGDKEDTFLREHTPREYLDKYAVLVSPKWWEAYHRSTTERHEKRLIILLFM